MERENWFNKSVEETTKKLNTNNTLGLTDEEVEKRKQKYGLNELEKGKKTPLIVKFLEQFKDFMIIVLITLFLKRFLIDKVIHFQSENRIDKESYLVELSLPFLIFSSFAVGIHLPIFLIVQ